MRSGRNIASSRSFLASNAPDAQGVMRGPLWFVGGGDPLFTSRRFARGRRGALHRLAFAGSTARSRSTTRRFAGPERNPRWEPEDLDEGYAAATSAVSLDEDTVEFDVRPGAARRARAVTDSSRPTTTSSCAAASSTGYSTDLAIDRSEEPRAARQAVPQRLRLERNDRGGRRAEVLEARSGHAGYVAGAITRAARERGIDASRRPRASRRRRWPPDALAASVAAARRDRDRHAGAFEQSHAPNSCCASSASGGADVGYRCRRHRRRTAELERLGVAPDDIRRLRRERTGAGG